MLVNIPKETSNSRRRRSDTEPLYRDLRDERIPTSVDNASDCQRELQRSIDFRNSERLDIHRRQLKRPGCQHLLPEAMDGEGDKNDVAADDDADEPDREDPLDGEGTEAGRDERLVGRRVKVRSERRLERVAARDVAVESVCETCGDDG